jgi:multidrug efflux system outer membrane protein
MPTRFQKTLLLLAALLPVGGCAVGPHYKSPQPAAVQFHAEDAKLETQEPFDARWWKQFEDPVLDSLVDRALQSNNSIRIARARLAESRAIFDERKLDRYPTVPVAASYQYSKEQIPGFGDQRRNINTFTTGFDAFWEADLFGRVSHGIAAARAENQAFEADLHDAQVSVVSELARNYFELRGAQWRLAVAERSLKNQRETLRLTQLRRDAGVGEEQDVASAAARVAVIESTIPSFEYDVSRAEYRLAVLAGTRPG